MGAHTSPDRATDEDLLEAIVRKLDRGGSPDGKFPDHQGEHWALCPYHNDTHPTNFSASVRGFKCFACGRSGSVRELAQKLGVDPLRCFPARDVPHPSPWRATPPTSSSSCHS